ncbi:MAG TPA: type II toxin-antitoxin system Phd/YefM family antitoxin [Deltaproteobacteria bacterium]|jgi:prevent-host-death family protein|nr:type II toxin-antitoxin system Phd/YefM family antitoxin [Deltaproteobacteria bacterium]HQI02185.1 type II toxin-antitoxin system Phd/YefM family antitoxin [Deltaproteobacteria bacterium]HQJ07985.1 type II toxin-antitoxin system Phd/YefM family antitoxin [Deltaproteobacteria bacterium]
MIRISTSELRKDTADALNKVAYGGDRIALQRRGKDVAVIVSVEDYELLRAIEDKVDLETMRKIKEEPGEDVPWEDLKKELGL